jgi:hypothetical protein
MALGVRVSKSINQMWDSFTCLRVTKQEPRMTRRNAIVSVEFKRKEFCFVKLHTPFTSMLNCDVIGMRHCVQVANRDGMRVCSSAHLLT